jgi:hypothetical protein
MNLKLNTLIAAFGAAILLAPASYAKTTPACQTGKLLDVQENTELVPTAQIGQARQNKNGKDWTTIALPPTRKQTTYLVKWRWTESSTQRAPAVTSGATTRRA